MKPHFTVIWLKSARQQLADIWLRANDRKSLSRTVDKFDMALKSNPATIVADDREGLRIATLPGLRIVFTITEDDRLVHVVRIRELH
jgi:hypothetical protein